MDTLEVWMRAGRTQEDWISHVLSKAGDRRDMARWHAADGDLGTAQMLMRSALARELYVASLRGEATEAEIAVVRALLSTWSGSSSDELLLTARTILASRV